MGEEVNQDQLVIYERVGQVGIITLNRPEKRNALNLKLWKAVGAAVEQAAADKEARVVVLRGAGKSFCAGLDLSPDNEVISMIMVPPSATQKSQFYKVVRSVQEIHNALERLPQPTIAAIHGPCLGAGLELAVCCDIRLCSSDALFALPEATLAIITDVGGLQRLPKVVGQGHAREIAYRGNRFDAAKAKAINLVNEVYADPEALNQKAMEMAAEIAANPPLAVQGAKEVFLYNDQVPMDEALAYTAARSTMIMPSEDLMEAVAAHMEKRKGNFKGA
jgi:enoyl-CoA hydratase